MLKTVGIILVLLVGALLLMASRQPDAFAIERAVVVSAPADVIYPKIADLHQWSAWSPYDKLDPQMKKVFNGTPGAAGATMYWSGNAKAGEGTMTVRELMPPSKITMQLDMLKPIEGHNVIEFNLEPADGGTRVTWAMRGGEFVPVEDHRALYEHGHDDRYGLRRWIGIAQDPGGVEVTTEVSARLVERARWATRTTAKRGAIS